MTPKKWPNKTTLSVPDDVAREVRKRAIDDGTSMSAIVTTLLRMWLAGEIELPPEKPERGKRKK